jgi:hypothetical protein
MSEQFTHTPGGAETIDQFNARVAQFCRDNQVVNVVPSVSGRTLLLTLAEQDDVPFPMPIVYQPHTVIAREPDMATLEKSIEVIKEKLQEAVKQSFELEELPLVTMVQLHPMPSEPSSCYILMLVAIGYVEMEAE